MKTAIVLVAAITVVGVIAVLTARPDNGEAGVPNVRLPADYHPVTLMYSGRPLYCILYDTGNGYGETGLTCDWVRYHR
jgi:hypothetical protein